MSIEFIGFIANSNASETIVRQGPVLDPAHIETVARRMNSRASIARCWRFIQPRRMRSRSRSTC